MTCLYFLPLCKKVVSKSVQSVPAGSPYVTSRFYNLKQRVKNKLLRIVNAYVSVTRTYITASHQGDLDYLDSLFGRCHVVHLSIPSVDIKTVLIMSFLGWNTGILTNTPDQNTSIQTCFLNGMSIK